MRSKKVEPRKSNLENRKIFRPHLEIPDTRQFDVEKIKDGFRITGKRIEQISIMTDMNKRGAIIRIYDVLKKIGAQKEMEKLGGEEGNKIYIGENVFDFVER